MSRLSEATKNRMYELAVEIIEHKRERPNDIEGICRLYDQTDSEWEAERIKSLMDELRETQAENQRMRVAMRMQHSLIGNPRKLFTCSSCEAEGLDEPLESRCHCMGENAHWIETVVYQPKDSTDDTTT